jgi:TonB family protein
MTPSKDTLEATISAVDVAPAQSIAQTKAESGGLRADAVSLDVPVKIHGSRVTEVVLGTTPHSEPFEEDTSTMIVFPQGGVVKMSTAVTVGQMVVLTNLKTGHDAICRILKVRAYGQTQSYVELEFTNRQPGYWGVRFASDETDPARPAVTPISAPLSQSLPPITVDVKIEKPAEKPAQDVSRAPAPSMQTPAAKSPEVSAPANAVKPPVSFPERAAPPSKPDSSFVSIGAQEDVQPAASSTSRLTRKSFGDSENNARVVEPHKKSAAMDFPASPPSIPVSSLSMEELLGDTLKAPAIAPEEEVVERPTAAASSVVESPAQSEGVAFGRFAASASLGGTHVAAREAFGAGLGSGITGHATESNSGKGKNWILIAACVGAFLVVGVGAAFHFHLVPLGSFAPSSSVSAPPAPAAQTTDQNAGPGAVASTQNTLPQTAPSNSVRVNASPAAAPLTQQTPAPANRASVPTQSATQSQISAPPAQKSSAKVPDMFGALNAHPVSPLRAGGSQTPVAEPSVDAGSSATNENSELPSIAGSSVIAPPPPVQSAELKAPVRVGGDVKPPRLISSALPVYPGMARQAGIDGDVVVDTTIDNTGNVASMKVISGPPMLRSSALEALRKWKYEPSKLNGEPIAVQMMVTIRFHRQ